MDKKKTIILIAIAVVFLIIGYLIGATVETSKYKKVIDFYNPQIEISNYIVGDVVEISGNTLSVEVRGTDPYKLPEEQKNKIYKVSVTEATKIEKFHTPTGTNIEVNFETVKIDDQIGVSAPIIKDAFEAEKINIYTRP